MKVNKTTEACAKRNAENKATIDLGLMEAWEPSDEILRQEAQQRVQAKSRDEFLKFCGQFWLLVKAQLSADDAKVYSDKQRGTSLDYDLEADKANGYYRVGCEIQTRTRGYSSGTKLSVQVGSYGDQPKRVTYIYKPNAIASLAVDVEFAKKVAASITERMIRNRQKYAANIERERYAAKKTAVYNANQDFFQSIGVYSDFRLDDDGTLTLKIQVSGNIERIKKIVEFANAADTEPTPA